jgi:hypothetical protein
MIGTDLSQASRHRGTRPRRAKPLRASQTKSPPSTATPAAESEGTGGGAAQEHEGRALLCCAASLSRTKRGRKDPVSGTREAELARRPAERLELARRVVFAGWRGALPELVLHGAAGVLVDEDADALARRAARESASERVGAADLGPVASLSSAADGGPLRPPPRPLPPARSAGPPGGRAS